MSGLRTVIDQMDQEVTFSFPPKRIVSLVPSQTEFLLDIGAPVVGRTKFCVHPSDLVDDIQIIGGTKNFRFEKIKELAPDLIIGNKEENYQAGINQLRHDFPVWMSDIHTLKDAFSMMSSLGVLCQEEVRAETIIEECTKALHKVKDAFDATVVYLIWKDPWMAVGRHTFVDHMLTHLGYRNLIKIDRYPELDTATIKAQQPDKVLLSSEPYPFKRADLSQVRALWPNAEIELVDGELFSWYGSRLRKWSLN